MLISHNVVNKILKSAEIIDVEHNMLPIININKYLLWFYFIIM